MAVFAEKVIRCSFAACRVQYRRTRESWRKTKRKVCPDFDFVLTLFFGKVAGGEGGGGSDAPLINCSTPTFLQRQDRMLLHNISSPPLNKNSWINSCRVAVSEEPFENTDEQSS